MTAERFPHYIEIDGLRLAESYLPEEVRSASSFKPSSDDVIVATYPKCGTTWMCQIVRLILMEGEHTKLTPEEYYGAFPFFEFVGEEGALKRLKPGCIKTHFPFDRLNFSEKAKYIYVARHPRDCVVSFYHHSRFFPIYRFSDGCFDTYFELFIKGMVDYNDYFDHLLSWYQQRHQPNVLFLTFESMKADHRGTILKVAEFLECSLTNEQIDDVIKYSSFDYMKTETNDIFDNFMAGFAKTESGQISTNLYAKAIEDGFKPVGHFIRKGVVGEGKLMLSEEQNEKLNARILEKTKDSDVMSIWENI